MPPEGSSEQIIKPTLFVAGATLAAFIFDCLAPRGIAAGLVFLLPLLLVHRQSQSIRPLPFAGVASLLVVAALFFKPASEAPWQVVLIHRCGIIGTLFLVAYQLDREERTERALVKSEVLFRQIFDHLATGIAITDEHGQFLLCNKAYCSLLGYDLKELQQREFPSLLHPDDRQANMECTRRLTSGEITHFEIENRYVHRDGKPVWVRKFVSLFPDPLTGRPQHMALVSNITKERMSREALQRSEANFRTFFDNVGVGALKIDLEGKCKRVNDRYCALTGYSREELLQMRPIDLVHPEDRETDASLVKQYLAGEIPAYYAEKRYVRKDGSLVWVRVSAALVRDENGRPLHSAAIVEDITQRIEAEAERRRLEARLLQTQKYESLGVLASGVAHDFNNLLTSMLGYSSLALENLPADSPATPMIREVEEAAQRAGELTRQMLAYAGKGKFHIERIRLDELVQEMLRLLRPVIARTAATELQIAPAEVEGDATQIRQVVMNLITNASDALGGERGRISVRTGSRQVDAAYLKSPYLAGDLPSGNYAFIEVSDNGGGMDSATLDRIFDPFFTTKPQGRGLGLASTLGIVRGHHGAIHVTSEVGRGTTFEIFLPRHGDLQVPVAPEILQTDAGPA